MRQKDRPIPFPWPGKWWEEYRRFRDAYGWPHYLIVDQIRFMNLCWRLKPAPVKVCCAVADVADEWGQI